MRFSYSDGWGAGLAGPDNAECQSFFLAEGCCEGRHEDEAATLERYVATHEDDEGNAYARLGDVLSHLGRMEEARAAYATGIRQAEKYGHSGMADDLRLAIIRLGQQD